MARAVGFEEAEQILETWEFGECQALWSSSNYVYLATMEGAADGEQAGAIYKPAAGETPLWDFPSGLYQREVAAYELANLLGWTFVPPTVVREGPHGIGSLQLYINHDQTSHFFEQREVPELVPQLQRMAVFDFVANNADRKGGHALLDAEGRIWGIDHGLCFHEEYKLRTVIWDWEGEAVDEEWMADVDRVARLVEARAEEAEAFAGLLSPAERRAFLERCRQLCETRVYPPPGPHRSYPWPLV